MRFVGQIVFAGGAVAWGVVGGTAGERLDGGEVEEGILFEVEEGDAEEGES